MNLWTLNYKKRTYKKRTYKKRNYKKGLIHTVGLGLTLKKLSSRSTPTPWGTLQPWTRPGQTDSKLKDDDTIKCQLWVFRIQHFQWKYSIHKNEKGQRAQQQKREKKIRKFNKQVSPKEDNNKKKSDHFDGGSEECKISLRSID